MTVSNAFPEAHSIPGDSVFHRLSRFLKKNLDKLYSSNNWANRSSQSRAWTDYHFLDQSPSAGSDNTDYAKPVWRR